MVGGNGTCRARAVLLCSAHSATPSSAHGGDEWPRIYCLIFHIATPKLQMRKLFYGARQTARALATVSFYACLSTGLCNAQLPPAFTAALQKNADSLSPIAVSWTQQLGSSVSLQEWLKRVKLEPYRVEDFSPIERDYFWQDGMSYCQTKERKPDIGEAILIDAAGKPTVRPGINYDALPRLDEDREVACDLTKVYLGMEKDAAATNPDRSANLSIDSIDAPKYFKPQNVLFEPTYFHEAGFKLPARVAEMRDGAKSLPLSLLSDGYMVAKLEDVKYDGRSCILLSLTKGDSSKTFVFDPKLGYAVVRKEVSNAKGQRLEVSEAHDFVSYPDVGLWLPQRITVAYYTWKTLPGEVFDTPLGEMTFNVRRISKDPIPAERFHLRYVMPRTSVVDSTLPGADKARGGIVRYQVPVNAADLDAAVEAALRGKPFVPTGAQRRRYPVGVIVVVIVSLFAFVILLRRYRSLNPR
jgi:hypothetical protein